MKCWRSPAEAATAAITAERRWAIAPTFCRRVGALSKRQSTMFGRIGCGSRRCSPVQGHAAFWKINVSSPAAFPPASRQGARRASKIIAEKAKKSFAQCGNRPEGATFSNCGGGDAPRLEAGRKPASSPPHPPSSSSSGGPAPPGPPSDARGKRADRASAACRPGRTGCRPAGGGTGLAVAGGGPGVAGRAHVELDIAVAHLRTGPWSRRRRVAWTPPGWRPAPPAASRQADHPHRGHLAAGGQCVGALEAPGAPRSVSWADLFSK